MPSARKSAPEPRGDASTADLASIDPDTSEMQPLFNPRLHQWHQHFQLRGGAILPRTAVGHVTVRLLQLNRSERVKERELMIRAGILWE